MPNDDDMARFSDLQLTDLRTAFELHKDDFKQHKAEQDERWSQLAGVVESNTAAVQQIAEAVSKQAESTAGIVQIYHDLQGAARIGGGVRRFLIWLGSLGAGGIAVAAALTYILDYFTAGPGA